MDVKSSLAAASAAFAKSAANAAAVANDASSGDDTKNWAALANEMETKTGYKSSTGGGSTGKTAAANEHRVRIYTKTGDTGTTSLYNNKRSLKSEDYFEALGDVDELNAHIGMCYDRLYARAMITGGGGMLLYRCVASLFIEISSRLMDVGSHLATPKSSSNDVQIARASFDAAHVTALERSIDQLDALLPPLKNFVLPIGGGPLCVELHVTRTVCRRAERHVIPLVTRDDADPTVLQYLNRLSDWLFVMTRCAQALCATLPEQIYQKPKTNAASGSGSGSGGAAASGASASDRNAAAPAPEPSAPAASDVGVVKKK